MDLQKFKEQRPFLYHLTSQENLPLILIHKKLFSANKLIDMSENNEEIKRERRSNHYPLVIKGKTCWLRDQRPISEKALSKCLTNNWTCADYYQHLNNRVFTWPTIDRLWRHYNRYIGETPIIFRFDTSEIIEINSHVTFCRLNSGATRANSYLGGIPPERGIDTFVQADIYQYSVNSVAEVTFENELLLPKKFESGFSPEGEWKIIQV